MRQRGFTLIEVLIALLILAIVITTTLLVFVERTRRLQDATETILAYQALSNEAEVRRRIDFSQLDTMQSWFISDTTLLDPLYPYSTYVTVHDSAPNIKNVTLFVRWRQGKRFAKLELVRVDTGGSNLW
jgi:prepilin-type N-terminal cleavage/methylation domain-containing protein